MSDNGSAATLDEVYAERNQVIACFARACHLLGMRAWLGTDPEAAKEIPAEWGPVVFIELPTGQVSWHIRSDEVPMFSFLMSVDAGSAADPVAWAWDGHDAGIKFDRLVRWKDGALKWHPLPRPLASDAWESAAKPEGTER